MRKDLLRSPVSVIVLTIITCGLYSLYWLYSTSDSIKNFTNNQNASPALDLLLSILCFPYMIYWIYKTSVTISDMQISVGVAPNKELALLNTILAALGFSIVAMAIMQSSINKVWES